MQNILLRICLLIAMLKRWYFGHIIQTNFTCLLVHFNFFFTFICLFIYFISPIHYYFFSTVQHGVAIVYVRGGQHNIWPRMYIVKWFLQSSKLTHPSLHIASFFEWSGYLKSTVHKFPVHYAVSVTIAIMLQLGSLTSRIQHNCNFAPYHQHLPVSPTLPSW